MDIRMKAAIFGIPLIVLVVAVLFFIGYLIASFAGLPSDLAFPLWLRGVGGAIVLGGLSIMGWVFKQRGVKGVFVSTYVTFTKMFGRAPMEEKSGREEPLVIVGPYRYVRHPLYFGVVVMVLGWGMLTAYPFVLISTVIVLLWFALVVARFEEVELRALFGRQYDDYSSRVPMIIPFLKLKRGK